MKKLVLTHANCTDGCCARSVFERNYRDAAEYIAVDHSELDADKFPARHEGFLESTKHIKNSEVIMADLCLSEPLIDRFLANNNRIVILDHASAVPTIRALEKRIAGSERAPITLSFSEDNSESGAMLAWKFMHPGKEPPLMVKHVSDGDLWQFKLGDATKFFYASLNENERQPKEISPEEYILLLEDDNRVQSMVRKGEALRKAFMEEVHFFAAKAKPIVLSGETGWWVEAPLHLKSDLGNVLAQKNNTFGLVVKEQGGLLQASLRSVDSFRVKEIAERWGGGGHPQASAFRLKDMGEFRALVEREKLAFDALKSKGSTVSPSHRF